MYVLFSGLILTNLIYVSLKEGSNDRHSIGYPLSMQNSTPWCFVFTPVAFA